MKWPFSVVGVLVILVCPLAVVAQECPFPDSVAVPDTLDPVDYFPMAIGNRWEYTASEGAFPGNPSREEIVGDTTIGGIDAYVFRREVFRFDPELITKSEVTFDIRAVIDSVLVNVGSHGTAPIRRLDAAFGSCYQLDGDLHIVRGDYGGEALDHEVQAEKSIFTGFAEYIHAYAIGVELVRNDPDVSTRLVYARVNGTELGTPLTDLYAIAVTQHSDTPEVTPSIAVSIFPNPASSSPFLRISGHRRGRVELTVVDQLGRLVHRSHPVVVETTILRLDLTGASGSFFAKIRTENTQVVTPFVLNRVRFK